MEALEILDNITAEELTREQLKDLRRMRKDTQEEIATLRQQHVEHPEKRHHTASLYAKLVQVVMKLIAMEQTLMKQLEAAVSESKPEIPVESTNHKQKQSFPAATISSENQQINGSSTDTYIDKYGMVVSERPMSMS